MKSLRNRYTAAQKTHNKSVQKFNNTMNSITYKHQQSTSPKKSHTSKSPTFKTPLSPKSIDNIKKKQKSRTKQQYKSRSKSKKDNKSSKIPQKKVQVLIKNLLEKHEQMKRNLHRLRLQKQAKQDQHFQKCSFSPTITRSPRYKAKGTFLERQRINLQQRQSQLLRKQIQKAQLQVKQCRFRPEIVSKEVSLNILHKKQIKKEHQKHKETLKQMQISFSREDELKSSKQNKRKDASKSKGKAKKVEQYNWQAIRYAVKLQLQRIDL